MFEGLTERLSGVFDRLSGRGVLTPKDIDEAMREVRVALLEADVALPVVREFIDKARVAAAGEAVIRSVKPADQVVKIVYDGLVEMLGGGGEAEPLRLALNPPTVILGKEAGVDTLPILTGQAPADIARRALSAAKLGGFDVLILDTAGRTTLDLSLIHISEPTRQADIS